MAAELFEFRPPDFSEVGEGFGPRGRVGAEGIGDGFEDAEVAEPLFVGGDDVPGGVGGGGFGEDVFVGGLVVVPEGALFPVADAEFPGFFDFLFAFEEALFLLVFGDVEEELEDEGAAGGKETFESVDVVVAGFPDGFGDEGVDADDEDVFVVGAVEEGGGSFCGSVRVDAPEKIVAELFGGGDFEAGDGGALGVEVAEEGAEGAVFATGVHALQDDEEAVLSGGVKEGFELGEFGAEGFDAGFGVFFGDALGVTGVDVSETDARRGGETVRQGHGAILAPDQYPL